MKLLAIGAHRINGKSKAGNQFDMCQLLVLVPIENVANEKVTVRGHGMKEMSINLDPAALDQFAGMKFPANIDVTIEPRPSMGKLESTVVGLLKAA